jgi:hypothetical protein
MTTAQPEFAICIANEGYEDLEVWKVYRLMPEGGRSRLLACDR